MNYAQLTQRQRYQISALLRTEHSQTEIASAIGVHKSTINRELVRNCGQRGYRSKQAHRLFKERQKAKPQKRTTIEIWATVDAKLQEDWSPEQIAGWLRENMKTTVSHEWIYQHIYKDKQSGGDLHKHLRCQKKRRKRAGDDDRRGKIPHQVSLEDRSEIVAKRERIGDWEADTMIGAGMKGATVTLVDRKSRFTLLKQVARRTAIAVEDAILDLLGSFPNAVHTITFDNGKEFTNNEAIAAQLQADMFFAHPYASWERGTNEYTNGLIRQYFSKGSDFSSIGDDQISFVNERLNEHPRKCLDFHTPLMVFSKLDHGCT